MPIEFEDRCGQREKFGGSLGDGPGGRGGAKTKRRWVLPELPHHPVLHGVEIRRDGGVEMEKCPHGQKDRQDLRNPPLW